MKTRTLPLVIVTGISLVTPALAVVNIDYAFIGNVGNLPDAAPGSVKGAVAYAYQIAKNETTIGQYAEFLNAVAKTDTYSLYRSDMASQTFIAGITQTGSPGTFTYSVVAGSANKPITYVSWFDAARFCNWLQNGQQTGPGAATTAESGAYMLDGATSGIITKSEGATVWIPSEDEWYKAAYYDPNKGGVGGYWTQATRSDTLAGNTIGVANSANYNDGNFVGYPGMALTDVGAYGLNSASAYGTNDQAGNVSEWNDAISDSSRGLRGGSWANTNVPGYLNLDSSVSSSGDPASGSVSEGYRIGFRVASAIPEPTSLLLTMMASGVMLIRRKRKV